MIFSYTRVNSITPFGKLSTRKVPLVVIDFKGKPSYNCIIDSGASISHMHGDFGRCIGLDIESGIRLSSKGIPGISFISYIHTIRFKLGIFNCKIDVAFSDDFKFDVGLLGREGFFDLFKIHFHQRDGYFEIEPY